MDTVIYLKIVNALIMEHKPDTDTICQSDVITKDINKILGEFYDLAITFRELTRYKRYTDKYKIHPGVDFCGEGIVLDGNYIEIGEGTYIGSYSRLIGNDKTKIIIGKNVSVSHRVSIYTCNRKPELIDESNPEYVYECGDITVGDYSLLGINSVILHGVNIGKNCFVGANSVVTHNVPDYTVVAGNPAKEIHKVGYKAVDLG